MTNVRCDAGPWRKLFAPKGFKESAPGLIRKGSEGTDPSERKGSEGTDPSERLRGDRSIVARHLAPGKSGKAPRGQIHRGQAPSAGKVGIRERLRRDRSIGKAPRRQRLRRDRSIGRKGSERLESRERLRGDISIVARHQAPGKSVSETGTGGCAINITKACVPISGGEPFYRFSAWTASSRRLLLRSRQATFLSCWTTNRPTQKLHQPQSTDPARTRCSG
jgi:hypothetical protein